MSLHFFAIPALDPEPAQEALNRFCQAQRMVGVGRTRSNRLQSAHVTGRTHQRASWWLKIVFAALVAIDVSLIAWLAQSFRTADAVLVVLAFIAVACITAGIVGAFHY